MQRYNPARPFINAYNTYQMDKYLSPKVDARFQIHQDRNRDLKRSKSVIDLALTAYFSDSGHESSNHGLNPRFKSLLMSQVKLFLFSGHDTTSSTICYIFYVLSVYPSVLQRLRAEHDSVFGSDVSKTASLIACDSHILNQLPYTVAVIKETMRLFPAASTTRSGEPGFTIKDPDRGREYPTFGYLVWLIPHAVQRDPEYWTQPDRFLPERWLVSPGNILHPKKGTLRPFEHGPRSCIGKEMSMIEMKIVLALTSREFQITTVYDEVDRDSSTGIRTVDGERAYQVQHGQPSGNLPCRVTRIVEWLGWLQVQCSTNSRDEQRHWLLKIMKCTEACTGQGRRTRDLVRCEI